MDERGRHDPTTRTPTTEREPERHPDDWVWTPPEQPTIPADLETEARFWHDRLRGFRERGLLD